MVDYKDIGARIRAVRERRRMTQEQLAKSVGVGTAHISHIETGNAVPSLKALIDIINTLECSADELLSSEIVRARPIYTRWIEELLCDCTSVELKIINETVKTLKSSMRRYGDGRFQ